MDYHGRAAPFGGMHVASTVILAALVLGAATVGAGHGWTQAALWGLGATIGVALYHATFSFAGGFRRLLAEGRGAGLRQDGGRTVPRNMLTRLLVRLDGDTVLAAEFRNGTSANPYHVFFVRMERSGTFDFTWTDETGRSARTEARVNVG